MSAFRKIFRWLMGPFVTNRIHPRIRILKLHDVQIHLDQFPEPFEVINISSGGLAIRVHGEISDLWPENSIVKASLEIQKQIFPVTLKVRYRSRNLIGTQFESTSDSFRAMLHHYFEAEFEALRLAPANVEKSSAQNNTFKLATAKSELYVETETSRASVVKIVFLGHVLKKEPGKPLLYNQSGSLTVGSDTFVSEWGAVPGDILVVAQRFMECVRGLDPQLKKQIQEILSGQSH